MSTLKTLSNKFYAWRKQRDAVLELSKLSDRELSDIGIVRADIQDRVRGAMVG